MKILTAFYDLKVSPTTYDIISFLFLAEMVRLRDDLDAIDLAIVVNDQDSPHREDEGDLPREKKDWMLHHVMLKADAALPSCRRTFLVPDRYEAMDLVRNANKIFPEDYSVDAPKPRYVTTEIIHLGLRGCPYADFEATPEALTRMENWLAARTTDRKIVTITLREMARQPARNSNLTAWSEFAHSLNCSEYFPIIIRDTNAVFQPVPDIYRDITVCDLASLNMELRAALYQHAYANLIINNGPNGLLHLNSLNRYLQLKPEAKDTNVSEFYERKAGYAPDYHFLKMNSQQIIVFESDSYENIHSNFNQLIRAIESGAPTPAEPWPPAEVWLHRFARYGAFGDAERMFDIMLETATASENLEDEFHKLIDQYAENLIAEDCLAEAKLAYDILVRRVPNDISFGLKRLQVLLQLNDFEEALNELEHLQSLGADFDGVHLIWGQCLIYVGRQEEALPYLENHIDRNPDDPIALYKLAEALGISGDYDRKIRALECALTVAPEEDRKFKREIKQVLDLTRNRLRRQ